jgi:hypothetical protein
MENKLRCRVVMLATDKAIAGGIIKHFSTDELFVCHKDNVHNINHPAEAVWIPQHLYLVSDEEIKKGDWYIEYDTNKILQSVDPDKEGKDFIHSKIEASTDPTLTIKMIGGKRYDSTKDSEYYGFKSGIGLLSHMQDCSIPFISKSFIEKYVAREGKIEYVNVEVEVAKYKTLHGEDYFIKINPDNTCIIFSDEEKLYTKLDMEKAYEAGDKYYSFDVWFNHNYKR